MKYIQILISMALIFISTISSATTYYVSPFGNDTNSGTSQSSPWRTIGRLQSLQYTLLPGDQILFERGGSYPGQLSINSSGTATSPIVIGSYGSGELPEISGYITPSGWTQYQGNIWSVPVSQSVKYVHVGNETMTLARYPNTGWMRVSTSNTTNLTSGDIIQAANYWNGAELVIRSTGWCYENSIINSSTTGSITYNPIVFNPGDLQWGFFIHNKLSELDSPGEWYYDNSGTLYFRTPTDSDPNSIQVKASIYEAGVLIGWQNSYIDIHDLAFKGQTYAGVNNSGGDHINVTGCTFEHNNHGIRTYGSYSNYSNNIIRNTFSTGLAVIDHHSNIENNLIEDIALIPGLGESFWGYHGMYCRGQSNIVRSNIIRHVGNDGIFIEGSGLVEKNIVIQGLVTLNDGGGIYFDNADGLIIQDNFVSDLDGNMESQAADGGVNFKIGHGIYFGNAVIHDVIVRRNTVNNCRGAGINVDHTMVSSGIEVRDNVLYDNDIQLSITDLSNYNGPGAVWPYYVSNYNDIYDNNILYCVNKDQLCMQEYLIHGVQPVDFGTHTNNKFFNPFNEQNIFIINIPANNIRHMNLDQWRSETNEESGSTISPHHQNANEVVNYISTNLLSNGNFDANINGWTGWPASGQMTRDATYLDNGSLKVVYNTNVESPEFYLKSASSSVQNGQWYEMSFSTQSNIRGSLRSEFKSESLLTGPNSMIVQEVGFGPIRRDNKLTFQCDLTEPGLMIFANKYFESTYWIDNVGLRQVDVISIDQYERHILLKNQSNSPVEIPLVGCWSDVNGIYYTNSIILPEWGSIVLAKEDPTICGLTTGIGEDEVLDSVIHIYPNPSRVGGDLFISKTVSFDTEVEVIDASGRSVDRSRMVSGSSKIPTGNNLTRGYYLVILRSNGTIHRYKLIVE